MTTVYQSPALDLCDIQFTERQFWCDPSILCNVHFTECFMHVGNRIGLLVRKGIINGECGLCGRQARKEFILPRCQFDLSQPRGFLHL